MQLINNSCICIGCCPLVLSDFIGVVKSADKSVSVTFGLLKRNVEMVDRANHVVKVTLWNDHTKKVNVSNNPVLFVRGAQVSEHRGMYIS